MVRSPFLHLSQVSPTLLHMGSPWQGRAVLWVPREAMTKFPLTPASWVPCCVLRNCVAPSPVPGLASRAHAVSGQGRSLDREVLWGKDTCHLGKATTTPRRPFSSPECQGRSEHSRAPPPHPRLQPPNVHSGGNTSRSHLRGGVPQYKDKVAPNPAHCGV